MSRFEPTEDIEYDDVMDDVMETIYDDAKSRNLTDNEIWNAWKLGLACREINNSMVDVAITTKMSGEDEWCSKCNHARIDHSMRSGCAHMLNHGEKECPCDINWDRVVGRESECGCGKDEVCPLCVLNT